MNSHSQPRHFCLFSKTTRQVFHSYVKKYNISRHEHPSSFGNNFYIETCSRDSTLYFSVLSPEEALWGDEGASFSFPRKHTSKGCYTSLYCPRALTVQIFCVLYTLRYLKIPREFDSSPPYVNKYKHMFQNTVCNLVCVYYVISTSVERCLLLPESLSSGLLSHCGKLKISLSAQK